METKLAEEKKKITDWVNNVNDKRILGQFIELINQTENPIYDPDYEATLSGKEKIEYWKKVGISGDELRKDLYDFIDQLPWKEK